MTTRYEAELREIESMIARPRKGQTVTPAMAEHVKVQRQRERERIQRTEDLGGEITLSFPEGEPVKGQWEPAIVAVKIGNDTLAYIVEPYEEIEGKRRLKTSIITRGYKGLAEEWAMWRWHITRGSEVDDTDRFILDCEAPVMVWEGVEEPKKRGRPANVAHA